jgi:kojibiose phosphorylase
MDRDFEDADPQWLVVEDGFAPARANASETIFTTGNGYLGTRGSLEEGHEGALPGTYLRGVFDHHDSRVIELVKAPDWLCLAVVVDGTRLDVTSASVVHHRRTLDMRQGALFRETVFEDSEGRRTRIETVRFASAADEHLCCLQARITPENHAASIRVHSGVDATGYNLDRRPIYTEPPPDDPQMKWHKWAKSKHFEEVAHAESGDGIYLETRTLDTGITIGYAARTTVSAPVESEVEQRHKLVAQVFRAPVAAGETLTVEKFVTIHTSRDLAADSVRRSCLQELRHHTAAGFHTCRDRHRAAWAAKWADSDVTIDGDADATRAVRFNIYHLLIAANESDPRVNIGANSLTGERYRGHAFWDTEVFMLPFFIYTQPETARALLLYRYHTLDGARRNARDGGFRGARYAWESADTGVETPHRQPGPALRQPAGTADQVAGAPGHRAGPAGHRPARPGPGRRSRPAPGRAGRARQRGRPMAAGDPRCGPPERRPGPGQLVARRPASLRGRLCRPGRHQPDPRLLRAGDPLPAQPGR